MVIETIGHGGMGVVARAYDPKLGREVALKLLRSDARGVGDRDAAARLIREARAMARLGHPNVVALFDAGEFGDQVYLAMELVQGTTLGRWREAQARPWPQVLEVLRQAGAGLVAAHAAGLVHRDFKPDNVLVGDDARARVTDFGIARGVDALAPDDPDDPDGPSSEPDARRAWSNPGSADASRTLDLTEVGTVLGTPPYMAPEQHRGEPADARADQYAWCITAWEALAGRRPYTGKDSVELARAKLRGRPVTPTRTAVPGWVWAAIERGLEPDPDRRWPDVAALLAALADDPRRRRRRWMAVATACVVGVAIAAAVGVARQRTRSRCRAEADATAVAWDDAARQRIVAAIDAVPAGQAGVTWDKLHPWLDAYAAAWTSTREAQCLAAELTGDRSPELRALGDECLDERLDAFTALVDALGSADALGLRGAVRSAADLPAVADCADDRAVLRRPGGADQAARASIAAVRSELRRARAQAGLGRYDRPLAVARAALERAHGLGWGPLLAEAYIAVGWLETQDGEHTEGERDLIEGFLWAGRSGHDDAMAEAATILVYEVGYVLARGDEGLRWGRIADMAVARAGLSDGLHRASLASALASIHLGRGEPELARPLFEEVLSIRERVLGPDHPEVASALENVGVIHHLLGDHAEAQRLLGQALAMDESALGADHPEVATVLSNLSAVHHALGEHGPARELVRRALAIYERSYGPDHPNIAHCLHNLATLEELHGELDEAIALYHRVIDIEQRSVGEDHPNVAMALHNLAQVLEARGDRDQALQTQLRAVAIFERVRGADHAEVGSAVLALGRMHETRGDDEHAGVAYERALAILTEVARPGDGERAAAGFELARLLWRQGRDRGRAIELARAAAETLRASSVPAVARLAEIEAALVAWSQVTGPAPTP